MYILWQVFSLFSSLFTLYCFPVVNTSATDILSAIYYIADCKTKQLGYKTNCAADWMIKSLVNETHKLCEPIHFHCVRRKFNHFCETCYKNMSLTSNSTHKLVLKEDSSVTSQYSPHDRLVEHNHWIRVIIVVKLTSL